MVDFKNGSIMKLKESTNAYNEILIPVLVSDEEIIVSFQAMRDGVVFTNKRIFTINVQGVTGKKKDITSLPYSKIQAFSVETAGVLDIDSELELYFSGLGKIKLEFGRGVNVSDICKKISENTL